MNKREKVWAAIVLIVCFTVAGLLWFFFEGQYGPGKSMLAPSPAPFMATAQAAPILSPPPPQTTSSAVVTSVSEPLQLLVSVPNLKEPVKVMKTGKGRLVLETRNEDAAKMMGMFQKGGSYVLTVRAVKREGN